MIGKKILDQNIICDLFSVASTFFLPDVLLCPSKWNHMCWSGDRATLTFTHLNKEDEGLYTLRVTTKSGYETYSAYVFVRGGNVSVLPCFGVLSSRSKSQQHVRWHLLTHQ